MLAYTLAVLVGMGSVGLYLCAFFFPEIHRKHDFIWSGVGLFYALVLWIYARRETGGILVGQTTSVALLGWFVWQTLQLRRQVISIGQQTPIPNPTKLQKQPGLKQSAPKTAKPTTNPPTNITKPTTPTKINPPTATPKSSAPADTTTPAIPLPSRPPVRQEATSIDRNPPVPIQQVSQPVSPDLEDIDRAEPEAWIKLEVKPTLNPSKPLGTPVHPPTPPQPTASNPATSSSLAIIPGTIPKNVPNEAIESKAPLDSKPQE